MSNEVKQDKQWWHCYIEDGSGEVTEYTATADTPEQAAVLAASGTRIAGDWTVVPGRAVRVKVTDTTVYQAVCTS